MIFHICADDQQHLAFNQLSKRIMPNENRRRQNDTHNIILCSCTHVIMYKYMTYKKSLER